jgi:hypothetical protein
VADSCKQVNNPSGPLIVEEYLELWNCQLLEMDSAPWSWLFYSHFHVVISSSQCLS